MIAVNIADLTTIQQQQPRFSSAMLLLEPVLSHTTVDPNPRQVDASAVILNCDDTRADAIFQVLRMKYTRRDLRLYRRGPRGGWHTIYHLPPPITHKECQNV